MDALAMAALLATANKALLDYLASPIRRKFPDADLWWFDYLALVTGALLSWFAGVNFFAGQFVHEWLGQLLSALLVGGGATLLNAVMPGQFPTGRSIRGW